MTYFVETSRPTAPELQPLTGPTVALIPAFNEERFIGSLVLTVQSYVDHVVVVDDGSSDRTVEIARKAGATVVQHKVNQGKAAAVNTGFTYVRRLRPAVLVMLDGDGQHCADDIPQMLLPVRNGDADVVVGSRFMSIKSDIPAYRKVGQHGLTLVTNLASGVSISDSQSGFRAFSARALEQLSFSQGGFSIESEMQFLVREHRLRVLEVPIKVIYAEPAKRNPVSHGMQVLNGILRLVGQIRPLLFFGLSGLVTLLAGLALGLHIVDIYARTQTLAIGYGLLMVMLCVIGMLLVFVGLVLHSTRGMLLELRRSMLDRIDGQAEQTPNVIVHQDEYGSMA
jgi:glycosyltransferase involved in cell wall biosynthesis